jgi:hypothetical protein
MIKAVAALAALLAAPAWADPAPFDLAGPNVQVTVTRQGVTLPIGAVPQLAAGDKVTVEAKLPDDQTAHYILVTAFLRDPTNPPPPAWFAATEVWKHGKHAPKPIELTIPANAQHLALFLAPATSGDFRTLRDAVQARPGAFVRAAQDLEQASLDRGRYEAYLTAIQHVSASSPETLAHVAPEVAASLHIKINEACLQRLSELQAACLLDAKQAVVLGNDSTTDNAMTGAATDLALSLAATPQGGLGFYSPYISAIHEIIGIFGAMRTAKYQYIPALGVPHGDIEALVLNTPPSFANPKSVLMAALPAIRPDHVPVLQIAQNAPGACYGASAAVLPLVATPLLYATGYAHDLALRVHGPDGKTADLPLTADATRGGLVIGPASAAGQSGELSATIHGQWGFDSFVGPEVHLHTAGDWQWHADGVARNDSSLTITGAAPACIAKITASRGHGDPPSAPMPWKPSGGRDVIVNLPPPGDKPEPVTLTIFGPEGIPPATLTVTPPARAPAPSATIVAHSSEPPSADKAPAIAIIAGSAAQIPADLRLNFTLKASANDHFTGRETVEVATATGDSTTRLTLGNGLTMVDQTVLVASLTPAQALGPSAFGALRARLVRGGTPGEWLDLGTLVRMPRLKALTCPADPATPCTLAGDALYLLASVAATPDFESATSVPEGFPGFTLTVPHPVAGTLYVRLHDAPEVVDRISVGNEAKQ